MDRTRFRRPAGHVFSIVLALSGFAGNAAAASYDDAYFVRQEIGPASGQALITQQALMPVTLRSDGNGSRLRARTVWFKLDAGYGQRGDSYKLDADYADDAAMAAFLGSGIETRLDRSGRVVSVGAADPQALEALARHRPQVREALARIGDAVGVRPFALPEKLSVGQRLRETQKVPGLGELAWTMRVAALDAQQVELEMQASSSEGAALTGYQVLRRDSGMPVEARLTLSLPDGLVPGQSEPMQLRMLAISQRHAVAMTATQWDAADWKAYREHFEALLASPEFRGEAVPADELRDLDSHLKQMAIAGLPEAEWKRIRGGLIFRIDETSHPRPRIDLSGQYDVIAAGQWPRRFLMRLKNARLLDANGEPLPDIEAIPNRLFELTAGQENLDLDERDEQFPFRLPPALQAEALDGLATIALDLELGGHQLQEQKVIARGQQAGPSSPTLEWSERWVELKHAASAGSEQDIWVIAPLDAQGTPIRHVAIPYGEHLLQPAPENPPPLSSRYSNPRYRVITAEPIAAIELRRYTLQWQPDTWIFANGSDLLAGGALIGVRHASEPVGAPAAAVTGQALLEAFDTLVDDQAGYKVLVPLRGNLQDAAARFCQARPLSSTGSPVYGVERRSRNDLFRSGDPGWVGWALDRSAFGDEPVAVRAICPQRIGPVVQRLEQAGCFQDLGNGYVGIAAACRADVAKARKQETLLARDAGGRRLAEFPDGSEGVGEDRLRFWGPVDTIEYLRVDEPAVSRDLPLPARGRR